MSDTRLNRFSPSDQSRSPCQSAAEAAKQHDIVRLNFAGPHGMVQRNGQRGRGRVTKLVDDRADEIRRHCQASCELSQNSSIGLVHDKLSDIFHFHSELFEDVSDRFFQMPHSQAEERRSLHSQGMVF